MAIEFVVEDGTGLSTATSYLSTADFLQFWENRGKDYSPVGGYTDDQIKAWLNNATAWLGYTFCYKGTIMNETQALDFPREHIWNKNKIDVGGTVPKEIIWATAYAAEYELKGKELNQVIPIGIKSKRIGPVTTTFQNTINAGSVQIRSAQALLVPYIDIGKVRRAI